MLARVIESRLNEFNAQGLANMAWAFAKADRADAPMFAALASSAHPALATSEFTLQGVANVAWAFAKGGQADSALFAALARAAEQHISDFNAQDLANTA